MRLFSSALPAALCLAVASALIPDPGAAGVGAAKAISPIVGTWEAKEGQLRNGDAGTTMIFSDAGTVTIVIGAMIDGK
jgi:hypothetical protein